MGTYYFTTVVFGVAETPEMREAREREVDIKRRGCTGNIKHQVSSSSSVFCSLCGSPIGDVVVPTPISVDPTEHYSAPGLEGWDGDRRSDHLRNTYVFDVADEVVIGVRVTEIHSLGVDTGVVALSSISPAKAAELAALLEHNNIVPGPGEPRFYLVLGYY